MKLSTLVFVSFWVIVFTSCYSVSYSQVFHNNQNSNLISYHKPGVTICLHPDYDRKDNKAEVPAIAEKKDSIPVVTKKELQSGPVRVADSAGTSVELFHSVKTSYHKLEIGTDELLFCNVSFGIGTEKRHIIFTGGANCTRPRIITYGCGFGTGFTIRNKLGFSASVIAQQMRYAKDRFFRANVMGRAYVGLEYNINPKFRIGFGPTFNVYTSNTLDNYNSNLLNDIPSYRQAESTAANNLRMWVGGKISLKFF